jgi:hypothetical protein
MTPVGLAPWLRPWVAARSCAHIPDSQNLLNGSILAINGVSELLPALLRHFRTLAFVGKNTPDRPDREQAFPEILPVIDFGQNPADGPALASRIHHQAEISVMRSTDFM